MADHQRNCSVEGCQRPHKGHGYCRLHLRRLKENGDPHQAKKAKPIKQCSIEGCDRKHFAHGWCRKHYLRWWDHGSTDTVSGRAAKGETERFLLSYVGYEGDDCILWPFGTDQTGYGQMKAEGERWIASHFMCRKAHGEPPSPIHQSAHSCGNRPCINPNHLSWKTPKENDADKIVHGTALRGERNPFAKVTESDVREMRRLAGRLSLEELSDRYGITASRVNAIIKRIGWKHVA